MSAVRKSPPNPRPAWPATHSTPDSATPAPGDGGPPQTTLHANGCAGTIRPAPAAPSAPEILLPNRATLPDRSVLAPVSAGCENAKHCSPLRPASAVQPAPVPPTPGTRRRVPPPPAVRQTIPGCPADCGSHAPELPTSLPAPAPAATYPAPPPVAWRPLHRAG